MEPEEPKKNISSDIDLVLDKDFLKIAKDLQDGRAQFLFGAGMAYGLNLPLGSGLCESLITELLFPEGSENRPSPESIEMFINKFPFETLVEAIEKDEKRNELSKLLTEKLIINEQNPIYQEIRTKRNAYRLFNELINIVKHPKLVLTTNFDNLFEILLDSRGAAISKNNFQSIPKLFDVNKIPVLHIHGYMGFSSSEPYTITEKDIFNESYNPMMKEFEKSLYESDSFVFVGYSMSDPDIKLIYRKYIRDIEYRANHNKKTYIVHPSKAGDSCYHHICNNVWKSRNATWLPFGAEEFFHKLLQKVSKLKNLELRNKVKDRYSNIDDNELDKKIKATQEILGVESDEALGFLSVTPLITK